MDVKFDFKAHQLHRIDTINILAYTSLLIITVITIWKIKIGHRFRYINETGLNIILSLIVGALIKYVGDQSTEFTYLRVVPSGLKSDINLTFINQSSSQLNELTISTNGKDLTNLLRNLSANETKIGLNTTNESNKTKSLERLNIDYPLNGKKKLINSNNSTSSPIIITTTVKSSSKNNNKTETTTVKSLINSTQELTTQQAAPITENILFDKKPTIPLTNSKQNNSSIKPTTSSNIAKNKQAKMKESKKLPIKQIIKPSNQTAMTKLPIESNESKETNLNKLIKHNKNELTLKLSAPPDSLFINLDIEDKLKNTTISTNYVYLFKGELVNAENVETNLYISQRTQFDPEFFFNIIIPVIVFNSGYSLKRKFFFNNLGGILTYSFLGTIISSFSISIVVWSLTLLIPTAGFTYIDCLYFGTIISSTDISVLAFFNHHNVDVNLYALVLGDSVLSDAVVIVLVRSIDLFEQDLLTNLNPDETLILSIIHASINFLKIFSFSVFVGLLVGILNALLTKFTKLKDFYLLESSLFLLFSYSAFLIAELLNLSGIVSILFVAIIQSHYNYYNLSAQTQEITKKLSELLGFLAENFVISYLGVNMFINPAHKWSISIIIFSFIAIIIGRLLNIYPLTFLLNLNRTNKIPIKHQHVLFFAGLRGCMSYALAQKQTITESRQIILTTTSIIIIVTVIGGGSLLSAILDLLNIDNGSKESDHHEMTPFSKLNNSNNNNLKPNSSGSNLNKSFTSINGQNQSSSMFINQPNLDDNGWLIRKFKIFDCKFMKPLLTNSSPSLMDTFQHSSILHPIAKLLTTEQQKINNSLNHNYNDSNSGCGFSNVNFTGISTDGGDLIPPAEENLIDRNSNYQRYSFENSNFEESYLTFGINNENRDKLNGQLNEALEASVDQLAQFVQNNNNNNSNNNNDNGQQIIFDRLTHNQQTKSSKQSKN